MTCKSGGGNKLESKNADSESAGTIVVGISVSGEEMWITDLTTSGTLKKPAGVLREWVQHRYARYCILGNGRPGIIL